MLYANGNHPLNRLIGGKRQRTASGHRCIRPTTKTHWDLYESLATNKKWPKPSSDPFQPQKYLAKLPNFSKVPMPQPPSPSPPWRLSVVGLRMASAVRGQLATVASCQAPGEPSHCTTTSDSSCDFLWRWVQGSCKGATKVMNHFYSGWWLCQPGEMPVFYIWYIYIYICIYIYIYVYIYICLYGVSRKICEKEENIWMSTSDFTTGEHCLSAHSSESRRRCSSGERADLW